MANWNYENLDNDIEELQRNLLNLNEKQIVKGQGIRNKKDEREQKRLNKTINKLFKK